MPVHFLWFKSRLDKGHPRTRIAKEFSKRFGGNETTIKSYLSRYFPENLTLEQALWEYRKTVKTREQRSEIARRRAAAKTPEQRSEIARKREAVMTPEQRSERVRKAAAGMTPEQRSEIARKREAVMTPEQRSERVRKAAAVMTPEQRSERSRKAAAARTPEQRSEIARKAARMQRYNLVKDVIYVEELPLLNRLSEREKAIKFVELSPVIRTIVGKFRRRADYEDILGVVNLAVAESLAKWDKRVDLTKLVEDSAKLHLIKYFGQLKRWNIREIPIGDIRSIDALVGLVKHE
ncbi:MAG: hypothetical protein QT03_C0001G1134 [archaeon GW2011_AR10]|nr:MAG: hypothetical protein QT03_C0001G1134 [archaeon GW2011_AR10]